MNRRTMVSRAVVTAVAAACAAAVVPIVPASAAPSPASGIMLASKADRGSLKVVANGVPQGRSVKITVAGKKYRKKLPRAGKLRNLRPGTYRVWAAPIVVDGGTAAVPNLPLRVKVPKRKATRLRLTYQWNAKTDSYPPGPVTGLDVTGRTPSTVSLRWTNSQAPDLQGVAIRRKVGTAPPSGLDDGRVVEVARDAPAVTDSGLRPFTVYSYSVFMVDTAGNVSAPATVTARTVGRAATVVAGTNHTCALLSDPDARADATVSAGSGTDLVTCWGANDHGQLGLGDVPSTSVAQLVDLPDVVQLAAGSDHTCARQRDGAVWCWGRNDQGQLGDGTTDDSAVPVRVSLPGATDIVAGGEHTCAVTGSAAVRCWGSNEFGQVGTGGKTTETAPVPVSGLTNVGTLAAGWSHTCAVLASGSVRCWGHNDQGQLGNNSRTDSAVPVKPTLGPVVAMTAGVQHTCALLVDDSVSCWGGNEQGQVGDGSTADRLTPVAVLASVTTVSAGAYHTCAAQDTGSARCWGRNSAGRLGDGTTVDRLQPTRVAGLTTASVIAAGAYHSCAVTALGTQCWGFNGNGQLGTGALLTATRPVAVLDL